MGQLGYHTPTYCGEHSMVNALMQDSKIPRIVEGVEKGFQREGKAVSS